MHAVISNRIYIGCSREYHNEITDQLTYKFQPKTPTGTPEIVSDIFRIKNVTSIPVGRFDLIPEGYEIQDNRLYNPVEFPELNKDIQFRDDQQNAIDTINTNYIINANPGWGKTFTGVALARKLGQKTLVVVHTQFLRDQWYKECKHLMNGVEPGIIGGGKYEINSPIVIGNVQSLTKRMGDLSKEFGTIIMDECHHVPADTFKNILDKSKARYKIGLTATLGRKDGKHILIPDYISDNTYYAKDENSMKPKVYMIETNVPFESNPMVPWGTRITKLVENPEYQDLVVGFAITQAEKGYKVLVSSGRVGFLELCNAKTLQSCDLETELVVGSTKNREAILKDLAKGRLDIIYGSQKIFSEGISEKSLSCLVLAEPINNSWLLEQICNRITRKKEGKKQPIIIDLVLKGATGKNQAAARENFYINKGWTVDKITA